MAKDDWQTPQDLFDKLDEEFGFDVDAACITDNCLCGIGFTEDSLNYNWNIIKDTVCWMNPPYSRSNPSAFCKKAYEESQKGCTVVGLLPCDCSTKWFQTYVMKAHEIRFLSRRVRFIDPDTGKKAGSPTFGSVVVVWKPGNVDSPKVSTLSW